MDDRVTRALASRVVQRLVEEDETAAFDDREEEKEEDWGDEGELDQCLTGRSALSASVGRSKVIAHGSIRSVIAKMLDRVNVSVLGSPRVLSPNWRFIGTMTLKS